MASDVGPVVSYNEGAPAPVKRRHSIEWSLKAFLRGQSTSQDSMQVWGEGGGHDVEKVYLHAS